MSNTKRVLQVRSIKKGKPSTTRELPKLVTGRLTLSKLVKA